MERFGNFWKGLVGVGKVWEDLVRIVKYLVRIGKCLVSLVRFY
jgi:hypothetical protein